MEKLTDKINTAMLRVMEKYFENDGEALDGDDVDDIIRVLYFELNLMCGNITQEEHDKGLEKKTDIVIYKEQTRRIKR